MVFKSSEQVAQAAWLGGVVAQFVDHMRGSFWLTLGSEREMAVTPTDID
jgi:hypothetical protein